jgi:hypothetical protein
MTEDADTKTIVGVCGEVSEKNGWTTFHIDTAAKYPIRLATKLPAVIADARAVGQQTAVWKYKEAESDRINENTGRPYVNRYLNSVTTAEATAGGSGGSAQTAQTGTHPPIAAGDRDRSIIRQSSLKAATTLYSGWAWSRGDDPAGAVIAAAARFETWVMRDIDDVPFEPPVGVPPDDEPPRGAYPSDDIPF